MATRWSLPLLFALTSTVYGGQAPISESSVAREAVDATGFSGAVLVYDLQRDTYRAGHAEDVDRRRIPASTFKIFNSLVALETGVAEDERTIVRWDGVERGRKETNRDLDLQTAFRISAVPHFQEIARRIGLERMQHWVDRVGYGNRDISGGIDQFWLTGGLRISPREQVELLARLYRGDLPFSAETMAKVREIMVHERTEDHVIRAKTGWATLTQDENVGWWVGWIERGSQVHVFATVLEARAPDDTFLPARQEVTLRALRGLGLLEPGE